ncbi:thioredoxin-disulfide reductase [Akkermansiaceae bacterium]|nr:thioredoxin-disulfide reductase [Akkermansiaceae bacterium]
MENLIIIGTGPAGYTAAIYAARAELSPVILTGSQPGGQLTTTNEVENFPGFPDGIMGPELMNKMQAQAEKFGTRVEFGIAVTDIKKNDDGTFTVVTKPVFGDEITEMHAKTVIIASGATARYMGIEDEEKYIGGRGLTACAVCDGAFYKGVPVAVIGGGDSACEEADFLTKYASKVYLVHRRDELRASKIMAKRVMEHDKIEIVWDSQLTAYKEGAEGNINAITLENTVDGSISDLAVDGVFMAIGHTPNTQFISKELVDLDDSGYAIPIPGKTATKTPGLFVAGDVADTVYRQGITAAGLGCAAALEAEKHLAGH